MKDTSEHGAASGSRAVWVLAILALLLIPLLLLVSLAIYFVTARERAVQEARMQEMRAMEAVKMAEARAVEAQAQADESQRRAGAIDAPFNTRAAAMGGGSTMAGDPAAGPPAKFEKALAFARHMVQIQVVFDGFPTRSALGLVVWASSDRMELQSLIVAPAAPFQNVTGIINGQRVTRAPLRIEIRNLTAGIGDEGGMESGMGGAGGMPGVMPGMAGAMGGGMGSYPPTPAIADGVVSNDALKKLGLVAVRVRERSLAPVQIIGELAEPRQGEPLLRITGLARPSLFVSRIGTPLSVKGSGVQPGDLLFNSHEQPVALVSLANAVPASKVDEIESEAVPLADLFAAVRPLHAASDTAQMLPGEAAEDSTGAAEGQVENEIRELVDRAAAAAPADLEERLAELRKKLEHRFDMVQARRQRELEELNSRLEKLRASHDDRAAKKAETIASELKALTPPRQ